MIDTTKEVQIVYTHRLFIFMVNYCKETYKVRQKQIETSIYYLFMWEVFGDSSK